jgi:aldehyde dehydrogenase (NAD+)
MNSGQICAMTSRVLVQESIASKFIDGVKQGFQKSTSIYGDPSDPSTMVGPVADSSQFDRIMGLIGQGKASGAEILTGGGKFGEKSHFVEPTLVQVNTENPLWKQEVFGPVIVVHTFKTEEEAVQLANDTEYGLSGAVYSTNTVKALRVARQMETGMVGINVHGGAAPQVPFAGWKSSGQGRESGPDGLMAYLQAKTVHLNMSA